MRGQARAAVTRKSVIIGDDLRTALPAIVAKHKAGLLDADASDTRWLAGVGTTKHGAVCGNEWHPSTDRVRRSRSWSTVTSTRWRP
jgi:hypothetical protein